MRPSIARFLARLLPHLALVAVMLLVLGSQSTSFWQCEGQKCGFTAWMCCCDAPNDRQDAECDKARTHFAQREHRAEVGTCQIDCHCTMVVQDAAPSVSSAPFLLATPILFLVTQQFAPTFEAPRLAAPVRPHSSRGPPPDAVELPASPLRGPPCA